MKHRIPEVIERQIKKTIDEHLRKDEKDLRLRGLMFKHWSFRFHMLTNLFFTGQWICLEGMPGMSEALKENPSLKQFVIHSFLILNYFNQF